MSVFAHLLPYVGALTAFVLALGTLVWRVARARLLQRAGVTALQKGCKDPQGKAGLKIVDALTRESEPWYRAIIPGRKSDDG